MASGAVGLEQVGGVTHAAKGMVANADTRVSAAKALRSVSEGTHGRNYGPASDAHASPRGAEAETEALVDEVLPGYRKSAA